MASDNLSAVLANIEMGKQEVPRRRKKLDKGPNNMQVFIKKEKPRKRFSLKKPMSKFKKVKKMAEKKKGSVDMMLRTDLVGKRIGPQTGGK